ncbi:hypothetical protein ACFPM3_27895 [Streptomyces coeruleoprunus]|uniref:Lipoprotein n=1 Tax=Streptomyces coeruleoprunus TaxID=285563 RepID=A0ABV9XP32_9ACTN
MLNRKFAAWAALCATAAVTLTACGYGGTDNGAEKAGKAEKAEEAEKRAPAPPRASAPPTTIAGLTPDRIAARALDTTRAAGSLTARGTAVLREERGAGGTFAFALTKKGDCDGRMSGEGVSVTLREVNGSTYMQGDEEFWTKALQKEGTAKQGAETAARIFKGRWIKVPAAQAEQEGITRFCDVDALLERATESGRGLTRGPEAQVGHRPAVTLTKKNGAETVTYYVAAQGRPYLLRFTVEGGDDPGTMELSGFGSDATVPAPPAGEILDPQQLGG